MKTDRHGQAKILTSDEIKRLFELGFTCDRDRALFGICLYTACRINEACTLLSTDVYAETGVRAKITIRKGNTKGQQDTRQVATHSVLANYLNAYQFQRKEHLFPGRHGRGHLHPTSANVFLDHVLDQWFTQVVVQHCRGYCAILRYADDCMAVFEFEDDAQRFMQVLPKRLEKFGLRLNQTKTQLLAFGKRQAWQAFKDGKRLPAFDFLGLTHYWGQSRNGKARLKRKTSKKRFRRA